MNKKGSERALNGLVELQKHWDFWTKIKWPLMDVGWCRYVCLYACAQGVDEGWKQCCVWVERKCNQCTVSQHTSTSILIYSNAIIWNEDEQAGISEKYVVSDLCWQSRPSFMFPSDIHCVSLREFWIKTWPDDIWILGKARWKEFTSQKVQRAIKAAQVIRVPRETQGGHKSARHGILWPS